MLEVAYILCPIALIVFLVYVIICTKKLFRVIDNSEKTINLDSRCGCDLASHQCELLAKVNVLR